MDWKKLFFENGFDNAKLLRIEDMAPFIAKPEKLEGCRSVFVFTVPYPFDGKPGNLCAYARCPDYHRVIPQLLEPVVRELSFEFPKAKFLVFTDHSPFYEVPLAAAAGLGVRGKNGLLITKEHGSFVWIAELATDLVFFEYDAPGEPETCENCGRCAAACRGGALTQNGFDRSRCISAITQKKGELTEEEKALMLRSDTVWGCDGCQTACPHNIVPAATAFNELKNDLSFIHREDLENLTEKEFREKYSDRAFTWRGLAVLKRNVLLKGDMKMKHTLNPADILLPEGAEYSKWSVVACDQYTSEPEYWKRVSSFVGGAPSALYITLPEVYLEKPDVEQRIREINKKMEEYLHGSLFRECSGSLIYTERTQYDGAVRQGLIGMVDLEEYDYHKGSQSLIRATEGTVLERIPPRVRVRKNAALEIPHIMLLIDDEKEEVFGPLSIEKADLEKVYDFGLMEKGGSVAGYLLDDSSKARVIKALDKLADQAEFQNKYGVKGKGVLQFAVGDGNHSLATAKECYEQLKAELSEEKAKTHPARYALVELVNLHSPALEFEPIHRVVFDVDPEKMMDGLSKFYQVSFEPSDGQYFGFSYGKKEGTVWVKNPSSNLAVGTLQNFIDAYVKENGGRVDYIHGADVVVKLTAKPGCIGFILPAMDKSALFPTVILDGVLPRKTFSMGHAWDKRYYLESRKIR